MSITLTPVLELDPGDYKNPEREYILSDFTLVREQFWQDCLKDSGIVGLEPYNPASWFVKLSDIDLKFLEIIIYQHSEKQDRELLEELDRAC